MLAQISTCMHWSFFWDAAKIRSHPALIPCQSYQIPCTTDVHILPASLPVVLHQGYPAILVLHLVYHS